MRDKYTPLLLSIKGKTLVCLGTALLLAAGIYGATQVAVRSCYSHLISLIDRPRYHTLTRPLFCPPSLPVKSSALGFTVDFTSLLLLFYRNDRRVYFVCFFPAGGKGGGRGGRVSSRFCLLVSKLPPFFPFHHSF